MSAVRGDEQVGGGEQRVVLRVGARERQRTRRGLGAAAEVEDRR